MEKISKKRKRKREMLNLFKYITHFDARQGKNQNVLYNRAIFSAAVKKQNVFDGFSPKMAEKQKSEYIQTRNRSRKTKFPNKNLPKKYKILSKSLLKATCEDTKRNMAPLNQKVSSFSSIPTGLVLPFKRGKRKEKSTRPDKQHRTKALTQTNKIEKAEKMESLKGQP